MRFGLLGPLEVADGDRTLTPTAPKLREVLALLLVRANKLVLSESLVAELWEGDPPSSASTTIQTYIYQLRKALRLGPSGETADILVTRPGGYLARIGSDDLDLWSFERLVERGRKEVESGDPERAASSLREALALWRGPALADVTTGRLLRLHVTSLNESRGTALELRIEADLRLGRHRQLISELSALIAAHPVNEAYHAQLMLAFARSGRRCEALQVYQQLRRALVDELGVEPSMELRRLQQAVLSGALQIEPAPRVSVAATAPAGPRRPGQLPPDSADYIGRREVLGRIERLVTRGADTGRTATPVVAISGRPGVGKTSLAVRVGHLLRDQLPDGQLYAPLSGADGRPADPAEVLASFLRALGVSPAELPTSLSERSHLFRTCTADLRLLVVLDDAVAPAQIRPLLPSGARCAALATSRRTLYGLAGAAMVELDVLRRDEAVALLGSVGGARVDADRSAAEAIVEACDLLPLAVRAAGTRLAAHRHLSVRRLAARLGDEDRRLAELRSGEFDLAATFEPSYRTLAETERRAFRLLSLCQSRVFGIESATALLDREPAEAELVVGSLVAAQLLQVVDQDAHGHIRYGFDRLLRDYARLRLTEEETPAAVVAAQARACCERIADHDRARISLNAQPAAGPALGLSSAS